jgi:hypothetical protein
LSSGNCWKVKSSDAASAGSHWHIGKPSYTLVRVRQKNSN